MFVHHKELVSEHWHLLALLVVINFCYAAQEEITPYKFKNHPYEEVYAIPLSSRFTISRPQVEAPEIVYYMTKPQQEHYPIAILCGGSSHKENAGSIIALHRYFLKEFLDLGCAVLTVEQWGVDGDKIDRDMFMEHYTRTQRLQDHQVLMDYISGHKPTGWDGTFVLLGASEGGPLVTTLTEHNADVVRATINWCGAGHMCWDDELWLFIKDMRKSASWWMKLLDSLPRWLQFSYNLPKTRASFDECMQDTVKDPCVSKLFMGMTYRYHADALQYPAHDYHNITTPFLVVAGTEDSIICSSDMFVEKAKEAQAPITYLRIEGMDHYVRKRDDVVAQSFAWLKEFGMRSSSD